MSQLRRNQTITTNVAYAYKCDNCGKVEQIKPSQRYEPLPDGWERLHSSHNEWGNDSVESDEDHHVCSWACYVGVCRKVLAEWPDYPSLTIDGHDVEFIRDMLASVAALDEEHLSGDDA